MADRLMHKNEIPIDAALVRRLVAAQFPQWQGLTIRQVDSNGTDNAMYRLGNELVVRLPRVDWAVAGIEREQQWLSRLGPTLPFQVPIVRGNGKPSDQYPWPWSIFEWLKGENPIVGEISDPSTLADDLARFILALQQVDPTDGPAAERGVPLLMRDVVTRQSIDMLTGLIDTDPLTDSWSEALEFPPSTGPAVWIHSDLQAGNLLLIDGRLSAVIDFSLVGVGDPACELIVAWNLLPPEARPGFRAALGVDDVTWARGRAWALSVALLQLPYYWETNPPLVTNARHVINQVLADREKNG